MTIQTIIEEARDDMAQALSELEQMNELDAELSDFVSERPQPDPLVLEYGQAMELAPVLASLEHQIGVGLDGQRYPRPLCYGAIVRTDEVETLVRMHLTTSQPLSRRCLVLYMPESVCDASLLAALASERPGAFNHHDVDLRSNTAYYAWVARRDGDSVATEVWVPIVNILSELDTAVRDGQFFPVVWVGPSHVAVGGFTPSEYQVIQGAFASFFELDYEPTKQFDTEALKHAAEVASAIGRRPWLYEPWPETEYSVVVMPEIFDCCGR